MISILLLVHLLLLINTQFTLWPEMVVYPYLLNNHFNLYSEIINNYPPLFIFFLSFWTQVFGYQPINFQILTYLIIATIDLSIFIIADKLFGKFAAYFAVLFFVILSVPFGINGLWFDLAITPFILTSFFLFSRFLNKPSPKTLFFSFLLLTTAFFIKQQVIWLLFWFLLILSFRFRKRPQFLFRQILIPLSSLPVFTVIFLLFFYQKNLLNEYIFWIFRFPFSIASPGAGYHILPTFRQLLPVVALFLLFVPTVFKKQFQANLILAIALILVAFAYRFDFFHLIPVLAIISLVAGFSFKNFFKINRSIYLLLIPSILILSTFTISHLVFSWHKETRFFEREIYQTAKVVELLTDKNERIYVQNGPDQIFPLANRLPPKPWTDDFSWYLEIPNLQERVIDSLEKDKPRYIIFQPYLKGEKYGLGSYRPDDIADYIDNNYVNFAQIDHDLYFKARK